MFALFSELRMLNAVIKRNLIVDLRYKFQIIVEITWTAVNVLVFVLLGAAWDATASPSGVPYSMITFFLVATGFYTVFSGVMESTVDAIIEENKLGTMGFLVTNSVSPVLLIVGRYIAATARWMIVLFVIVIPPLVFKGVYPSSLTLIVSSTIVFIIAWIFMMGVTLIFTSVSLIFKKTTTFNKVGIYVVRFASGGIVPIFSFDKSIHLFGKPLSNLLIWFPPTYALESLRWIFSVPTQSALQNGGLSSKDGLPFEGFNQLFGLNATNFGITDPTIHFMLIVSIIFVLISIVFAGMLTKVSRKWGTIEFY